MPTPSKSVRSRKLQLLANELFRSGETCRQVRKKLGISQATAYRWHARWQANLMAPSAPIRGPGRPAKSSREQLVGIKKSLIAQNGRKPTLREISRAVRDVTGKSIHPSTVKRTIKYRPNGAVKRRGKVKPLAATRNYSDFDGTEEVGEDNYKTNYDDIAYTKPLSRRGNKNQEDSRVVNRFIKEACVQVKNGVVGKDLIYCGYLLWTKESDASKVMSYPRFCAAIGGRHESVKPHIGIFEARVPCFDGFGLHDDFIRKYWNILGSHIAVHWLGGQSLAKVTDKFDIEECIYLLKTKYFDTYMECVYQVSMGRIFEYDRPRDNGELSLSHRETESLLRRVNYKNVNMAQAFDFYGECIDPVRRYRGLVNFYEQISCRHELNKQDWPQKFNKQDYNSIKTFNKVAKIIFKQRSFHFVAIPDLCAWLEDVQDIVWPRQLSRAEIERKIEGVKKAIKAYQVPAQKGQVEGEAKGEAQGGS